MTNRPPHRLPDQRLSCVFLLAVLLFSVFSLTGSQLHFGYMGLDIAEAESWVMGIESPPGRSGIVEVATYVPSAMLKAGLARFGKLMDIQWIAYVFVQPALATILCLIFYGFCLDLYDRRHATAVASTLVLAFCTMVWPYAKYGMENGQSIAFLAAVWALWRYFNGPTSASIAAFALSLVALVLTKMTGSLLCLALFGCAIWLVVERRQWREPGFRKHAALVIAIGLAGFLLMLASNRLRYGGWVFAGRYNRESEMTWLPPISSIAALLISPGKSIFLYSPPILLGVCFLGPLLRRFRTLRPVFVSSALLVLWFVIKVRYFNDETWGPRRLHFLIAPVCLALGCWWELRPRLSPMVRYAGVAVVGLGLFVQATTVPFDYTAHAFTFGETPIYSMENTVWQPQLSPIRFNLHLLLSWLAKQTGHDSVPIRISQTYCPWTAPDPLPPPLVFDVSEYDNLDFWYLQQRRIWPKPWWFRFPASWLVPLFALAALGAAWGLRVRLRRRELF